MKKTDSKKWVLTYIIVLLLLLVGISILVFVIDPFFHFRKPDNRLTYGMTNERMINDGIIKNFDYNALITGTSMTENFKTSELDTIFGVHSVKVPFAGASFKEIDLNCKKALENNENLVLILRGLDIGALGEHKDLMMYDFYPEYLYDTDIFNDVNYLLNKQALLEGCLANVFMSTLKGREHLNFDEYMNWNDSENFGREAVLSKYNRIEKAKCIESGLDEREKKQTYENITQNVIQTINNYPNTKFYLYLTPYSIVWWDSVNQQGHVLKEIEKQKITIELLLECDNVELYSFCDNFELITDLNNYRDATHYSEDINSQILHWMKNGNYKLTSDNYIDYLERIEEFYCNYNYDSIQFEE